jgi:hypothetical protein
LTLAFSKILIRRLPWSLLLICQVLQNLTRIYILRILAPPVINDTTKKDIIPLSEEQKEILGAIVSQKMLEFSPIYSS